MTLERRRRRCCALVVPFSLFSQFFCVAAERRMAISIPAADGPAVDVAPDFPLFFSPFVFLVFFPVSPRSSEAELVADCPPSATSGTV